MQHTKKKSNIIESDIVALERQLSHIEKYENIDAKSYQLFKKVYNWFPEVQKIKVTKNTPIKEAIEKVNKILDKKNFIYNVHLDEIYRYKLTSYNNRLFFIQMASLIRLADVDVELYDFCMHMFKHSCYDDREWNTEWQHGAKPFDKEYWNESDGYYWYLSHFETLYDEKHSRKIKSLKELVHVPLTVKNAIWNIFNPPTGIPLALPMEECFEDPNEWLSSWMCAYVHHCMGITDSYEEETGYTDMLVQEMNDRYGNMYAPMDSYHFMSIDKDGNKHHNFEAVRIWRDFYKSFEDDETLFDNYTKEQWNKKNKEPLNSVISNRKWRPSLTVCEKLF